MANYKTRKRFFYILILKVTLSESASGHYKPSLRHTFDVGTVQDGRYLNDVKKVTTQENWSFCRRNATINRLWPKITCWLRSLESLVASAFDDKFLIFYILFNIDLCKNVQYYLFIKMFGRINVFKIRFYNSSNKSSKIYFWF